MDSDGVRSPINYATAYLDLDFIYGRSEDEAESLRTLEGGLMNITDEGWPIQNPDGTWLVNARYTVTGTIFSMCLPEFVCLPESTKRTSSVEQGHPYRERPRKPCGKPFRFSPCSCALWQPSGGTSFRLPTSARQISR